MEKPIYEDIKTAQAIELVKSGRFANISNDVRGNLTSYEKAVAEAMDMCLVKDVDKRSTSMEVEKFLHKKLKQYGVSEF
jgi:hypothetical protein